MAVPERPIIRRSERIPMSIPVTLLVEFRGTVLSHPAYMVDASIQGVRLRASVDLSPGQSVEVVPSEGPKYAVPSRVVWVRREGPEQEAELGLEFLNALPMPRWPQRD